MLDNLLWGFLKGHCFCVPSKPRLATLINFILQKKIFFFCSFFKGGIFFFWRKLAKFREFRWHFCLQKAYLTIILRRKACTRFNVFRLHILSYKSSLMKLLCGLMPLCQQVWQTFTVNEIIRKSEKKLFDGHEERM